MLWKSVVYDEEYLSEKMKIFNQNELITTLLLNKKKYTKKDVDEFLNLDESMLHNPFLLENMKEIVNKIISHMNTNKKILIYGDYDIDGILGSYYLSHIFDKLKIKHKIYIPKRSLFKLSVNEEFFKIIERENISTLITVDNSIGDMKDIKRIIDKNIDIIITDHHYNDKKNFLEINPKKSLTYPFKELSGTGVVFKLLQAILIKLNLPSYLLYENIELVALATISDVMECLDENRFLIKYGIENIKNTKIKALSTIIKKFKINPQYINICDISYRIAPLFNAISKLDDPKIIIKFLRTKSQSEIEKTLLDMYKYNQERKKNELKVFDQILKKLKLKKLSNPKYIYYELTDLNNMALGSLTSKIALEFKLPSIIISKYGNYCKGSLRSFGDLNVYKILEKYRDHFISFGGHKLAAGFIITKKNLDKIRLSLRKDLFNSKYQKDDKTEIFIDANLDILELNLNKIEDINRLGPFGLANNEINFYDKEIQFQNIKIFGVNNKHFKAIAVKKNIKYTVLGYNLSNKLNLKKEDKLYKIVYTPEIYEEGKITLKLKDIE